MLIQSQVARLTAQLEESREREQEFRQLSDRSKKEVDGYAASINKIQTRFMEALKDRGTFEHECNEAKEEAAALQSALASSKKENTKLEERNAELQKKLTEATDALLHSSVPGVAKMTHLEQDLAESRAAAQQLQKRLTVAQGDLEYAKTAYQQASQAAAQLRTENRELETRAARLADDRDSHNPDPQAARTRTLQLQQRREVAELVRMLDEQRAIVRDRENEIQRLRDEVRGLRATRRDTRQSSVPRSPRLSAALGSSVLSPRSHSHSHSHHHQTATPSARGAGGSSRAASPMSGAGTAGAGTPQQQGPPPMGIFETPLLGRHAHLRD